MAKVIYKINPNTDTVIILKNPLIQFAVWNYPDVEELNTKEPAPPKEALYEEAPYKELLTKEFPTKEPAPYKEFPAKESPAEEPAPYKELPAEEPPTKEPIIKESVIKPNALEDSYYKEI
ncbi:hypothetical protein K469DRAFT_684477 [Zopfia rhizophila CBS 207.26]|uniref:Uncharacterized protein n=1 Tax=Zopfia rhizophila CBS 207.26 TaxID=1314779 RepID=A0A6A6D9Y3_9PEZI|nr:hypothetical protein K469DRAFT_684477 [Zopfia rhizophila CBS 207.26]